MKNFNAISIFGLVCMISCLSRADESKSPGAIKPPEVSLEEALRLLKLKFSFGEQVDSSSKSNRVEFNDYFIASATWSPSGESSRVDTLVLESNGGKLPFWELVLLANEGVVKSDLTSPVLVVLVRKDGINDQVFIVNQDEEAYWNAIRLLEHKNR